MKLNKLSDSQIESIKVQCDKYFRANNKAVYVYMAAFTEPFSEQGMMNAIHVLNPNDFASNPNAWKLIESIKEKLTGTKLKPVDPVDAINKRLESTQESTQDEPKDIDGDSGMSDAELREIEEAAIEDAIKHADENQPVITSEELREMESSLLNETIEAINEEENDIDDEFDTSVLSAEDIADIEAFEALDDDDAGVKFRITSLERVKTKTKTWLIENLEYTKGEAADAVSTLDTVYYCTKGQLENAPFTVNYEVVKD